MSALLSRALLRTLVTACILALVPTSLHAAGSQTFSTAGTYSFTIPSYDTLTVQVWGGGGGGGGSTFHPGNPYGPAGTGGQSSFQSLIADGGAGGNRNVVLSTSAGGAGGSASGGSVNTAGNAGLSIQSPTLSGGSGGSAPNGGTGGAGGAWYSNGSPGNSPGAGGGGASRQSTMQRNGSSPNSGAGGGGSGGYTSYTYTAGSLSVGASVPVVVGAGGNGGYAISSAYYQNGGSGAPGQVTITWTDPVTPTCSVWADTSPIAYGGTTVLRWTTTNASSMYITNVGWVGTS
ncbi:MAG: hypothetical protein KBE09_03395, partial [Candidatus Pacebacteria bacterium]|nr:hypothetical protein [Candidatus Paceibacterota bacterium]